MSINPIRSYNDVVQEIVSKQGHLIRKTLLYISPLTNDLEYRVAYFIDPAEECIWEGEMMKKYQDLGIVYECYTHYMKIMQVQE